MGAAQGAESKTVVNNLSKQISNIAASTVQTCEVAATQDQNLTVANTGFQLWGSYKLDQQTEIRSDCFNDVNKQIDLQNKIIQAISQAATSENVGLLGAFGRSSSEATSNLTNIVQNNITMSNIQKSYSAIKQSQTASFTNSGVIGFQQVELTQGSKLFAAATLKEIDRAGIFNAITTSIDQTAASKMKSPLDFIAETIGAVTSGIAGGITSVLLVIGAVLVGVFLLFRSGSEGNRNRTNTNSSTASSNVATNNNAAASGNATRGALRSMAALAQAIPVPSKYKPLKAALAIPFAYGDNITTEQVSAEQTPPELPPREESVMQV